MIMQSRNPAVAPAHGRPWREGLAWGAVVCVLLGLFTAAARAVMATSHPLTVLVLPVLFGMLLTSAVLVRDAVMRDRPLEDDETRARGRGALSGAEHTLRIVGGHRDGRSPTVERRCFDQHSVRA
jgi:hypothetical protein